MVICGYLMQAAAWIIVFIFIAACIAAMVVDASEGYPGAGVWIVSYLAPVTVVPSSISDLGLVLLAYIGISALYVTWAVVFGIARGMGDDLLSADGGNLVSIITALLVETTPYFAVAYVFIVARSYTGLVVRNRVERCMQAVARVEADHELATRAARV